MTVTWEETVESQRFNLMIEALPGRWWEAYAKQRQQDRQTEAFRGIATLQESCGWPENPVEAIVEGCDLILHCFKESMQKS